MIDLLVAFSAQCWFRVNRIVRVLATHACFARLSVLLVGGGWWPGCGWSCGAGLADWAVVLACVSSDR